VLGWPKRCELAHAFLWEYGYQRLKLGHLTSAAAPCSASSRLAMGHKVIFLQAARLYMEIISNFHP
jgi:hypothetical protein